MKLRSFAIIIILVLGMGCQNQVREHNSLVNYFSDIDLQCETDEQCNEVKTGLNDMLTLSPEDLKEKRYKNYRGIPGQWDIITLLNKHIVSVYKGKLMAIDEENFYLDVTDPQVKQILRKITNNRS